MVLQNCKFLGRREKQTPQPHPEAAGFVRLNLT